MAVPVSARALDHDEFLRPAARRDLRADLLAVLGGVALVTGAWIEGHRLLRSGVDIFLGFPPLLAGWAPHVGPGSLPAVLVAVSIVAAGPGLAVRLRWPALLLCGWLASAAWILSLALVDGWSTGVAGRLTTDQEYLNDVPRVGSVAAMLREFSDHILTDQAVFWSTHVGAHPPGALLTFVVLDRIGLGGGGPAGLLCIAAGSSAAVAVAVALRALGTEAAARRVLPFAVLTPAAVWIGVSADGLFAGVLAWAVALSAVGATGRGRWAGTASVAGGALLGYCLYLSYGLVLAVGLAVAVVALTRRARPVALGVVGAAGVAAAFTLSGFWWPTGYELVRVIYAASIARGRPSEYFWWANLAALLFAVGPAVLAGLRRWTARPRSLPVPCAALAGAALGAVLLANLSGLSKGEVERIWLPFAVWLTVATALLPAAHWRGWLMAQALLALLVNHLLLTVW